MIKIQERVTSITNVPEHHLVWPILDKCGKSRTESFDNINGFSCFWKFGIKVEIVGLACIATALYQARQLSLQQLELEGATAVIETFWKQPQFLSEHQLGLGLSEIQEG